MPPVSQQQSRRSFLRSLFRWGTAFGVGMVGWTVAVEPQWQTVSHYSLPIPHLPARWHGKRLIHLTDLHSGRVSPDFLVEVINQVNELQPDFLAITGDLVDVSNCESVPGAILPWLSVLKPARMATVACLGNHDYGWRWSRWEVAAEIVKFARDAGITVLRDQLQTFDGLDVFGLEDYWTPAFRAEGVLRQARPDRPSLCLCHNPDVCDEPVWDRFRGIILSGHTHGGQCKPPFLPAPLLPVKNRRYSQGFVSVDDRRTVFISRGIGHTRKVRFNCRPEIVVFELLRA